MMSACLAVALPQAAHPLATVNALLNALASSPVGSRSIAAR